MCVSFQSSSSNCTLSLSPYLYHLSTFARLLCDIQCHRASQRKRRKSFTQIIGAWHVSCCCYASQTFSPDKSFLLSLPVRATEKYWNLKKLGLLHQKEPILSIGHEFSLQQPDQSPGYHAYYYSHHPHQSFTRHQQVYPEIEGRSVSSSSKYSSPTSSSNDKKADRNHFKSQSASSSSSSSSGKPNSQLNSRLHVYPRI